MYVFRSTMNRVLRLYLNANKNDFTFLFNCGYYRKYAPCDAGLQWLDQHSKYAPFSDGLPIKKYHDGGELE